MPKQKQETFSQRLVKLRKANGLSQYDLEDITGISRRMIAHYETKGNSPTPKNIILLAKAFKVSIDELMGFKAVKEKEVINSKLLKKVKKMEELPPKDQKAVLDYIEALLIKSKVKK